MEFFKLFVFLLILAVGGVLSSPTEVPAEVRAPLQPSSGTSTSDLDTSETISGLSGVVPGLGGLGLNGLIPGLGGLGLGLNGFIPGLGGLGLSLRTPLLPLIPNFPFTYALQPGIGYVNLRQPVDPSVLLMG